MDTKEKVLELCKILYDKKATDIEAIQVGEATIVADWFIICSGNVVNQVKALCDEVEEKSESVGCKLIRKDGYEAGKWVVLDFGDILVHIFQKEEREYYNIDHLWSAKANTIFYPEK